MCIGVAERFQECRLALQAAALAFSSAERSLSTAPIGMDLAAFAAKKLQLIDASDALDDAALAYSSAVLTYDLECERIKICSGCSHMIDQPRLPALQSEQCSWCQELRP